MFAVFVERKVTENAHKLNEVLRSHNFELNLVSRRTGRIEALSDDQQLEGKIEEEYIIQCYYDSEEQFPPLEIVGQILHDKSFIYLEANSEL